MNKLNIFLRNEYIKLLKKLKIIYIDCFFCGAKNVDSYSSFSKCCVCELNSLKNKDLNWFIDQLKENWPIINYYPRIYNIVVVKNQTKILINFFNKRDNISFKFDRSKLTKWQLDYFDFLNSQKVSVHIVDYFFYLKMEIDKISLEDYLW